MQVMQQIQNNEPLPWGAGKNDWIGSSKYPCKLTDLAMQGSIRLGKLPPAPLLTLEQTEKPSGAVTWAENGDPSIKFPTLAPWNVGTAGECTK